MSQATALSPWYVVGRLTKKLDGLEYYTTCEGVNDNEPFSEKKVNAMLFANLTHARRIRDGAGDAMILVLLSKDDLKEFGR